MMPTCVVKGKEAQLGAALEEGTQMGGSACSHAHALHGSVEQRDCQLNVVGCSNIHCPAKHARAGPEAASDMQTHNERLYDPKARCSQRLVQSISHACKRLGQGSCYMALLRAATIVRQPWVARYVQALQLGL